MRKRTFVLAAACSTAILQATVLASITIDGSYDADYGTAVSLQTNNTGFGDSTTGDGHSGNELDALYAKVSGGNLNILITGNLSLDFSHLNLFIADGRPGQNTINANGALANMNTSKFSPGFNATYALDMNGTFNATTSSTTLFVNQYTMPNGGTAQSAFIGSLPLNDGTAHPLTHGTATLNMSFNDTNAAGVVGGAPSAADQNAAAAVQTGMEVSIPLSELGSPSGTQIGIFADINGNNSNGFLSNQFLPGLLGAPQNNLGNGGKFDFSGTPNFFATVTAPSTGAINGEWALPGPGSWAASSSWSGGVPKSAGDTALFGLNATGAATVSLDGSKSVARITFNNPTNSYTITQGSGGTLTIDDTASASPNPAINVNAGNHIIAAPMNLAGGVTISTDNGTSLTVSGNISGSGGMIKTDEGTLVLSGSNSFAGNIVSQNGVLVLAANNAASGATVILGDGDVDNQPATLNLSVASSTFSNAIVTNRDLAANNNLRTVASTTATTVGLASDISLNGGVVLSTVAGGTLTVTGLIHDGTDTHGSARHAIRIGGAGTVILSNAETNTGDLFVDSGTLLLPINGSLNGGSINVLTAGTMFVKGTFPATEKIYSSGTMVFAGNISVSPATLNMATLTVDTTGSVTFAASASSAVPVTINAGSVEFLGADLPSTTGKLDLRNNRLTTSTGQAQVQQDLLNGNLLTTSVGGTLGYKDNGSGTTIEFAVPGDADLNGTTDMADFMTLSQNFNQTGVFWSQGDFNYDGVVNALDFNAIASNFGKTLPAPALGSLVPEPAMLSLAALGLVAARRRRHGGIAV